MISYFICSMWQDLSINTLIFHTFDNDGHLWNLPLICFSKHKACCLIQKLVLVGIFLFGKYVEVIRRCNIFRSSMNPPNTEINTNHSLFKKVWLYIIPLHTHGFFLMSPFGSQTCSQSQAFVIHSSTSVNNSSQLAHTRYDSWKLACQNFFPRLSANLFFP
jgi:hypothetical protein